MEKHFAAGVKILNRLNQSGYPAYFVGGAIRDWLRGESISDIDITTKATPDEITELFDNVKPTGLKYGTVTVFEEGIPFEITTFRQEGNYRNHRHPDEVTFAATLEEDVLRRDFTINAIAMDSMEHIYDYVGGQADLQIGLIRAIGNPEERLEEDALRILRAFRFVAKTGFVIEPKTKEAITLKKDLLTKIANERIIQELEKILSQKFPQLGFQAMVECEVDQVFPALTKAIHWLALHDERLSLPEFFSLSFYLSEVEIDRSWRFSNKMKSIIAQTVELMQVTQEDEFTILHVYARGLERCLMANRLNRLLHPENDQEQALRELDESLPIRKTCDLRFKGGDILHLTTMKDAEVIGDIVDDLVYQVITHQLPNDYDALRQYTFDTYFKEKE